MNTSLRVYLSALRQFPQLAKQSPQQYFRRPGKDFTRTRILHLERVAWLTVTLLKNTLCVELDRFFDGLGSGEFSPTKSALVQARQKLLPRFFRDFFMFGVMLFSMTTFAADPKPAGADISEILLLLRRFNLLPEF